MRSKQHHFRSGRIQGGKVFSTGQLHQLLTNPVYLGCIRHKDQVWPGRHPAIIEQDLWDRVQQALQRNARRSRGQSAGSDTALLTGKLRDETGDRLTPTHSLKAGRRHRYYVSNRLISGGPDPAGWRLPARVLDTRVADMVAAHLEAAATDHRVLASPELRGSAEPLDAARRLAQQVRPGERSALGNLLTGGTLGPHSFALNLDRNHLAAKLGVAPDDLADGIDRITSELRLRRRGVEARLIVGEQPSGPDPVLLRTLREAHRWTTALKDGVSLGDIARAAGHHEVYIRTRSQLAFLSPESSARSSTEPCPRRSRSSIS